MAVAHRQINPEDIPATAKNTASTSSRPSQKKRKFEDEISEAPSSSQSRSSQPSSSQPLRSRPQPSQQLAEDADGEEETEEDVRDELYVQLRTSIVGVRYYKGMQFDLSEPPLLTARVYIGMVGVGEEVSLVREPRNRFDG